MRVYTVKGNSFRLRVLSVGQNIAGRVESETFSTSEYCALLCTRFVNRRHVVMETKLLLEYINPTNLKNCNNARYLSHASNNWCSIQFNCIIKLSFDPQITIASLKTCLAVPCRHTGSFPNRKMRENVMYSFFFFWKLNWIWYCFLFDNV